jgi:hypothetical protein
MANHAFRLSVSPDLPKQLVKLPPKRPVTFAGSGFQPLPVQNLEFPPAVADQTRSLEIAGSHRHALAMHAQHLREKLLRDLELVGLYPVKGNQQSAGEALLDGVPTVVVVSRPP